MNALKAKIFSHCTTNIDAPEEFQINAWLAENTKVEIVHILQSESMVAHDKLVERNLSITLLYREPTD